MNIWTELGIELKIEEQLLINSLQLIVNQTDNLTNLKTLISHNNIDWNYWLDLVKYHGVAPLIYYHFKRHISVLIPQSILNNLELYYRQNTARNLALSYELIKIVKILRDNQIPVLPYKGTVLAEYIYQNISLRCSCDIDIIVPKSDLHKVKNILVNANYQLVCVINNNLKLNPPLQWQSEYLMATADHKILIDVHQKITNSSFFYPLSMSYIWDDLTEITFFNEKLSYFDPNKLFFILATHGNKHCWEFLSWLCDLVSLITHKREELDFDKILLIAEKNSQLRMILLTLSLCQKLFLLDIPSHIQDKINQDKEINNLMHQSIKNMFSAERKPFEDAVFTKFKFYLQLQNTYQGKLRQILSMMDFLISPNLRDWDFLPLPQNLYLFYYLIRPFRLTNKLIFKS